MTPESIPRFDLYAELEISRLASVAGIESAYRSLVKKHHPDVAGSSDVERIKRLNTAREWLVDPVRRRRYDWATNAGLSSASTARPSDISRVRTPAADPSSAETETSFGPNAPQVRYFLAELRGLDRRRAAQVWDGRALAQTKGYPKAARAAMMAGRTRRRAEWLLAREAASVIARGKLGDSTLTDQVLDVLADTAGAIAIRDLMTAADFEVLMTPWTWRGAPITVEKPATAENRITVEKPAAVPKLGARTAGAVAAAGAAGAGAGGASGAAADPPGYDADVLAAVRANEAAAAAAEAAVGARAAAAAGVAAAAANTAVVPPAAAILPAAAISVVAAPAAPSAPMPSAAEPAALGQVPSQWVIDTPSPWQSDRAPLTPAGQGLAGASISAIRNPRVDRARPSMLTSPAGIAAVLALVVVGGAVLALASPKRDQDIAAVTDSPSASAPHLPGVASPLASLPVIVDPTAIATIDPATATPEPSATDGPNNTPAPGATPGPVPTAAPTPKITPQPTPTAVPTPSPTAAPTPTAGPTPSPTAAPTLPPPAMCPVINLFNVNTSNSQALWNAAGFTGTVTFSPAVPPQYKIKWQSLTAGNSVPCSSGIEVRKAAP